MSDWLDAEQARKNAWTLFAATTPGTHQRRVAALAFAEACERLDALDNALTAT